MNVLVVGRPIHIPSWSTADILNALSHKDITKIVVQPKKLFKMAGSILVIFVDLMLMGIYSLLDGGSMWSEDGERTYHVSVQFD